MVILPPQPDGRDWCPHGCGGLTEDPYGGPCAACWRAVEDADRAMREESGWW